MPGYICSRGRVFARACEMALGGRLEARRQRPLERQLPELDEGEEPSFTRIAPHEKRGVNSGPAESISFRTGQNHSEKGSSSPWPRTPYHIG